jgi:hypothetical protein
MKTRATIQLATLAAMLVLTAILARCGHEESAELWDYLT